MDDGTVRERDLGGGEITDALGGWMDTKGFRDDGIEDAEVSEFGVDGRDAINLVKDLREVCGVANRR